MEIILAEETIIVLGIFELTNTDVVSNIQNQAECDHINVNN